LFAVETGYKTLFIAKMGNSKSKSETLGVKAQAEGTKKPLYSLLDLNGKHYSGDFVRKQII